MFVMRIDSLFFACLIVAFVDLASLVLSAVLTIVFPLPLLVGLPRPRLLTLLKSFGQLFSCDDVREWRQRCCHFGRGEANVFLFAAHF